MSSALSLLGLMVLSMGAWSSWKGDSENAIMFIVVAIYIDRKCEWFERRKATTPKASKKEQV